MVQDEKLEDDAYLPQSDPRNKTPTLASDCEYDDIYINVNVNQRLT